MKTADIFNDECYCALAVSLLNPELVGPEVAFNKLGVNVMPTCEDRKKYCWDATSINFYKEIKALKEMGWGWENIANYYGLQTKTVKSYFSRIKKRLERRKAGV